MVARKKCKNSSMVVLIQVLGLYSQHYCEKSGFQGKGYLVFT